MRALGLPGERVHRHSFLGPGLGVRVLGEVRGINRVVHDVSGKPPATIEWA